MTTEITEIVKCRICGSYNLLDVIDLGNQPIPNGFLTKEELKNNEKRYPLAVVFCEECTLMQLKYLVKPKIMFQNYLYIPSSSGTRMENFRELAEDVMEVGDLSENSLVIDVGSNDGSLLVCFKSLGVRTLGIDPAENLVKVAELKGIDTVLGYFDTNLSKKVFKTHGKAKAILATNVIAHIQNLHEVLKGGEILLERDGIFVMQFPYLLDLLEKNLFDTIYHEHLSYFSVKSLIRLSEDSGLEIFDIKRNGLDGGALRVYWKKKEDKRKINKKALSSILDLEQRMGLDKIKTYENFARRVVKLKEKTVRNLSDLRKRSKSIVGYGAAAKANVLLNYFGIGPRTIDYIVDSTPYKQGLFTPGSHIPIFPEEKIYETKPDYVLIFAWNFAEEIMEKNKRYRQNGGKFILVEPDFKIV